MLFSIYRVIFYLSRAFLISIYHFFIILGCYSHCDVGYKRCLFLDQLRHIHRDHGVLCLYYCFVAVPQDEAERQEANQGNLN